jgi:hypothetical protein
MKAGKLENIRKRMKCFCEYAIYSNGCVRIKKCKQCKEQTMYDRMQGYKEAIRELKIKPRI